MTTTINASTSAGLVQTADTSGVLALQSNGTIALSTSGANVTIAGTLTTAAQSIAKASLPTGSVLQVVSTTKTDTFTSTTTGAFTDITGMSVSITPTSSTSKILVNVTGGCMGQVATSGFMLQLLRDSTAISVGDTAGSRIRASMNGYSSDAGQLVPFSIQYLDSPATTSATTYKIQFRIGAGTFYFNRTQTDTDSANFPRIASSITLMEIAA